MGSFSLKSSEADALKIKDLALQRLFLKARQLNNVNKNFPTFKCTLAFMVPVFPGCGRRGRCSGPAQLFLSAGSVPQRRHLQLRGHLHLRHRHCVQHGRRPRSIIHPLVTKKLTWSTERDLPPFLYFNAAAFLVVSASHSWKRSSIIFPLNNEKLFCSDS